MAILVSCPRCKAKLAFDRLRAHSTVRCDSCRMLFTITPEMVIDGDGQEPRPRTQAAAVAEDDHEMAEVVDDEPVAPRERRPRRKGEARPNADGSIPWDSVGKKEKKRSSERRPARAARASEDGGNKGVFAILGVVITVISAVGGIASIIMKNDAASKPSVPTMQPIIHTPMIQPTPVEIPRFETPKIDMPKLPSYQPINPLAGRNMGISGGGVNSGISGGVNSGISGGVNSGISGGMNTGISGRVNTSISGTITGRPNGGLSGMPMRPSPGFSGSISGGSNSIMGMPMRPMFPMSNPNFGMGSPNFGMGSPSPFPNRP